MRYPLEYSQILNRSKYNTFGWVRRDRNGVKGGRFHQGWDLQAPIGTQVFPVMEGKIVYAQHNDKPGSRYGKAINLKFKYYDDKTYYAFYAHLNSVLVSRGDVITDDSKAIGTVGDTGNAKGIAKSKVHLHFEIRDRRPAGKGANGRIDPVEFYGAPPPYDGMYYIVDYD